jgi:hypothetical protein
LSLIKNPGVGADFETYRLGSAAQQRAAAGAKRLRRKAFGRRQSGLS